MKKVIITIAVMSVLAFTGYQVAKLFPSSESSGWTRKSADGNFQVELMKVTKTYRGGKLEQYFEITVSKVAGGKVSHDTVGVEETGADFDFGPDALHWSPDGKRLVVILGNKSLDISREEESFQQISPPYF